ncbi:rRNA maturation RNase YbeY [Desulfosporosinus sp. BICA1-9]|uniref:rRNA maturation RNase YbeY n=1 Tax=Desulfosporosinus sp. BICA1-9 TaxID=1531958 RepID=UPI00054B4722|nr:rRNA maturation RNase YbeY [Desulfosporosinus sp. BICA1-9]KJS86825.1 MAG: rRNA maturation factor [Desulfosporosinus sp. BICA1-9]KJS87258.1 MAG: rRNA maturation factor [Desulfosporosinus sp. BICA1-9]HBW34957.1 rRNA maturation RNase YbeY [Desulfosporosinus sp.]
MILDISWEEESILPERQDALTTLLNNAITETIHLSGGRSEAEVSLMLVDDQRIHALNLEYRGVDRPTDVLSFALQEEMDEEPDFEFEDEMLGDIVISVERAREQAEEYGHSFEREIVYLAVHGTLHLLGYDHEEEDDKLKMRNKEEEVMTKLGLERV